MPRDAGSRGQRALPGLTTRSQSRPRSPSGCWAGRIVGFGAHEYRYGTGHGGVAPVLAFAPGRAHHTLSLESGFAERWPELVEALGPHRASVACLYLTRLANVDRAVLRTMLERSMAETLSR